MKVTFLTLSVSRRAAGMLDCVRRPAQELQAAQAIDVQVLSRIDADSAADAPSWHPLPVHLFPAAGPASFGYASGLAAWLRAEDADLVHTFGLWTYLSVAAHAWSRRTRRPYVVTPQGMLDPWALHHARAKKRVAGWLYERRHLRDAACLHAVCEAERDAFRAYGLRNPVCVIPNGVDLPPADLQPPPPAWKEQLPAGRKVLLYLGRLHGKKGLPNLLRAWAEVRAQAPASADEWCLVIAGWDQGGHEQTLRQTARELALENSVRFVGPLFDEAKNAAYQHADAFVLPSFSEGLPLVVLEAWSHRLPVLMTPACNLPEGFAAGAALRADPESRSLAAALQALFETGDAERHAMGARGRALVEQKFTWSRCAAEMAQVYRWLAAGGPRPACVDD